jgi:hypothetical protein
MMTKEKEVIEIPLSKQKLTLMLIGSIVFFVVGVLFVLEPEKYLSVVCRNPTMIFASGFASILFSTICAFYLVRKLPDNKPGLIINKIGLTDNSSGVAGGQILWSDIENITVKEIHRQKFILLEVNNPYYYLDKQTNIFKRKMMQMNMKMYGTPLSLTNNGLQIKFDELFNILNDHLNTSRQ